MARGVRKAASDSMTGLLEAAKAPDRSTETAPRDIPGVEALNDHGNRVYDMIFRTRPGMTAGDLLLAAEAAHCAQMVAELKEMILPGMALIPTATGATKINPILPQLNEQKRTFANLIRDLGIRGRDGKSNEVFSPKPEPHQPSPVTSDKPANWDKLRVQ